MRQVPAHGVHGGVAATQTAAHKGCERPWR